MHAGLLGSEQEGQGCCGGCEELNSMGEELGADVNQLRCHSLQAKRFEHSSLDRNLC